MKKLNLNLVNIEGLLTKEQMKNVIGGNTDPGSGCYIKACILYIQGDDGGAYVEKKGRCAQAGVYNDFICYCAVPGLGVIHPDSNGGVSRCTA